MVFVESGMFSAQVRCLLTDEEYALLQTHLIANPQSGPVIPHSGGLRKLRWSKDGKGKSGGMRVIYQFVPELFQFRMLLAYSKSDQSNFTAEQLKRMRQESARWK